MSTSGYIALPLQGTPSWKSPVATSSDLPVSGNDLGDARAAEDTGVIYVWTGSSWTAPSGSGTVTSVGLSLPAIFSVTGSPITGAGTLTATLASQLQNLVFASPNGSSGSPTFRALVAADIPSLSYVTSVAMTVPSFLSVSGSPITSSGTLALSLASQTQNLVFASPNGSSGAPTFRALVGSDLPTLSLTSDVTGTSSGASIATTVAKIQGTTVSGTTGTGNVVFSAAPTFTSSMIFGNYHVEPSFHDFGNSSTAVTLDLSQASVAKTTLTASAATVTLTNGQAGASYVFQLAQDSTGGRTLPTFSPALNYGANGAPTLSTAASKNDFLNIFTPDGTTFYCFAYTLGF